MANKNVLDFFIVVSCFVLFFLEGVNESIIGPIYPLRAKSYHGASELSIGFTLAMFPFGEFIGSIALANFNFQSHIHKVFNLGAILSSLSIAGFGSIDYVTNFKIYTFCNINIRLISGLALSCFWPSFYSILSLTFNNYGVKIATMAMPTFFLGITIGPQIALLMKATFGYSSVFYLVSSFEMFFAMIALVVLSFTSSKSDIECVDKAKIKKKLRARDILSSNGSQVFLLVILYFSITYGYIDGVLADILKNSFHYSEDQIQMAYFIASIFLVSCCFAIGSYLSTLGLSYFIVLFSCLTLSLSLIALYSVNYFNFTHFHIVTTIIVFVYVGRGIVNTAIVPAYDIYLNGEFSEHSSEEIRAVFMNVFSPVSVLGITVGSSFFIGIVAQSFGYFTSIIIIGLLGLVITGIFFGTSLSKGALSRRSFLPKSQ